MKYHRGGEMEPLERRRLLATFTVTTIADAGAGSLRQAVLDANASGGADTIEFEAATFSSDQTIAVSSEMLITDSLTIAGPSSTLMLDGGEASRIFNAADDATVAFAVTLADLTLVNGRPADTAATSGGALLSSRLVSMTFNRLTIRDSYAPQFGGGAAVLGDLHSLDSRFEGNAVGSPSISAANGGGLYAKGAQIEVVGGRFEGNTATSSPHTGNAGARGGGMYTESLFNPSLVRGVVFVDNTARAGGGLAVGSLMTVQNCTFQANTALTFGGGLWTYAGFTLDIDNSRFLGNRASDPFAVFNSGGGVYATSPTVVTNSRFEGNQGEFGGGLSYYGQNLLVENNQFIANTYDPAVSSYFGTGGGLWGIPFGQSSEPARFGRGPTTIDIDERGLALVTPGDDAIETLLCKSGPRQHGPRGELEFNFRIAGNDFTQNEANSGAAVRFQSGAGTNDLGLGTFHIQDNRFVANTAPGGGYGGSVLLSGQSLLFERNEVADNVALASDQYPSHGGGLYLDTFEFVRILNSTITDNSADLGGGVYLRHLDTDDTDAKVAIVSSTITGNNAQSGGGVALGGGEPSASTYGALAVSFANTIVAGNEAADFPDLFVNRNPAGPMTEVEAVATSAFGTALAGTFDHAIFTDDPELAPLDFYGGRTRTMPPQGPSSPAFNGGDNAFAIDPGSDLNFATDDDALLPTDQRGGGFPRIVYDTVDLGAAEFTLLGDANRDGQVDLADFVILRNHFGSAGSVFGDGDFNGDGKVDLTDFVILRNNFGQNV